MICEECGKRPASVHFTKIINGHKTDYHLCEQCAKEKGELIPNNDFSFHHLLSGLLNIDNVISEQSITKDSDTLRCETCGLTYSQFKKAGKFGCSDCYQYFESQLNPVFRRIHGNSQHSGKVPLRTGTEIKFRKELNSLKLKLQGKVANEEFEEAAKLRDKIKALESKLSEKRG